MSSARAFICEILCFSRYRLLASRSEHEIYVAIIIMLFSTPKKKPRNSTVATSEKAFVV